MAQGLPKSARLLRASEFLSVLKHAQVNLSAGPLRTRAIQNRMPRARLGLVVTKRGTPLAHERNRVKRLIRERFRSQASSLPRADIVIQVFGKVDERRLQQLLDEHLNEIKTRFDGSKPLA